MLLVIRLHSLSDLFNNLRGIIEGLGFEIVPFLLIFIPKDDHSKCLRVPSADLATHNHAERHTACLATAVEEGLATFPGEDVHIIFIHEEDALVGGGEGHWLFANYGVSLVLGGTADDILLLCLS